MSSSSGPAGAVAPVLIDDALWDATLAHLTSAGRDAAVAWREQLNRDGGVPVAQLRRCAPEGRDGTRLAGCAKLYVPAPAGPWGAVLRIAVDNHGRGRLDLLAFGPRHPSEHRASVYQLAHRHLHHS